MMETLLSKIWFIFNIEGAELDGDKISFSLYLVDKL